MSYKALLKNATIGTAAVLFSLGVTFNQVSAQELGGHYHGVVDRWSTPTGKQLEDYKEFVEKMTTKNGSSCCNIQDARINVDITPNNGPDKETHPYIATFTHDFAGNKFDTPQVRKIPTDKILTIEKAEEICETERNLNPESTCDAPPFSMVWGYDNSTSSDYKDGKEEWKITTLYCAFPAPRF